MKIEFEKETAFTDDNEFISPKIDYAFKQMMNNKIALSSFLSAILKLDISDIEDIQHVDTHTLKEYEDDKIAETTGLSLEEISQLKNEM